jgi:hypothetical protein
VRKLVVVADVDGDQGFTLRLLYNPVVVGSDDGREYTSGREVVGVQHRRIKGGVSARGIPKKIDAPRIHSPLGFHYLHQRRKQLWYEYWLPWN